MMMTIVRQKSFPEVEILVSSFARILGDLNYGLSSDRPRQR